MQTVILPRCAQKCLRTCGSRCFPGQPCMQSSSNDAHSGSVACRERMRSGILSESAYRTTQSTCAASSASDSSPMDSPVFIYLWPEKQCRVYFCSRVYFHLNFMVVYEYYLDEVRRRCVLRLLDDAEKFLISFCNAVDISVSLLLFSTRLFEVAQFSAIPAPFLLCWATASRMRWSGTEKLQLF